MIYLKRTLVILISTVYYCIVGPIGLIVGFLGILPSLLIGYIITGDSNIGPMVLMDTIDSVFKYMENIEDKLGLTKKEYEKD